MGCDELYNSYVKDLQCKSFTVVAHVQLFFHTSYFSILVHRRIIEVYKKYTKKLSELATK